MSEKKSKPSPIRAKIWIFTHIWLELGYGNITFSDELNFDPTELDIAYEDVDTEGLL